MTQTPTITQVVINLSNYSSGTDTHTHTHTKEELSLQAEPEITMTTTVTHTLYGHSSTGTHTRRTPNQQMVVWHHYGGVVPQWWPRWWCGATIGAQTHHPTPEEPEPQQVPVAPGGPTTTVPGQ